MLHVVIQPHFKKIALYNFSASKEEKNTQEIPTL